MVSVVRDWTALTDLSLFQKRLGLLAERQTEDVLLYLLRAVDACRRYNLGCSASLLGSEQSGIWKMPLGGGVETRVLDQPSDPGNRPPKVHWFFWALARGGIYFLNPNVPPNGRIEFFDFATRQSTPILTLDKPTSLFGGLALSPDGKSLLFGQNELDEPYVMLVKNFR